MIPVKLLILGGYHKILLKGVKIEGSMTKKAPTLILRCALLLGSHGMSILGGRYTDFPHPTHIVIYI